jgi:hypothetical protein
MAKPESIRSLASTIPVKKRYTLCGARSRFHLAVSGWGKRLNAVGGLGAHRRLPLLPVGEVGQARGDGVTYGFRCHPHFQGLRYTNDMEKLAEGRIMARYNGSDPIK